MSESKVTLPDNPAEISLTAEICLQSAPQLQVEEICESFKKREVSLSAPNITTLVSSFCEVITSGQDIKKKTSSPKISFKQCQVWLQWYYCPTPGWACCRTCEIMLHNLCMSLFKALLVSSNYSWKKLIFGAVSPVRLCVFKPTGHQINSIM